ncbi:HNH/endonuclease VII fold putative polymorphic toxin [Nocardia cerradoensis]|uniref:HNH/endonuclease VII fold putative polymorphic toxin n=1 Tax=Nocardia cerradoensis TaxID=85688 RepID=UPI0009FFF9BF|nr:hypothetical protein [Nocardia cerradoensis]
MQFETPQGSRVIVEHTHDPAGPHFHAGQPKDSPGRNLVNFGWDNSPGEPGSRQRYTNSFERYGAINKPGGDHHFFYRR